MAAVSSECSALWPSMPASVVVLVVEVELCSVFVYILAKFKVIPGLVPTCDRAHSWQLYSAASLGNQVVSTIT